MNIAATLPLKPGTYDVHVVPTAGTWAVKSEHVTNYRGYFQTQTEAIAYGMALARQSAAMLVIHGRDGQFREVRSYR